VSKYPRMIKHASYGRVYEVSKGTFFPSVTTVLKYGLPTEEYLIRYMIESSGGNYDKHLEFSGEASEIGTAVHSLIERIVQGEVIEISNNPLDYVSGKGYYPTQKTLLQIKKALGSFIAFWKEQQPEILEMETLLYSTKKKGDDYMFPFAGRVDMICNIVNPKTSRKEKWLLDIKTSKQCKGVMNYGLQLSMYTMLYNINNPKSPIERMGIIWAKKDYISPKPPKSVVAPIEYEFRPELVKAVYTIFQEVYQGFTLGEPKLKEPTPKVFSLIDD
tara:strand:+ start:4433 stop:5254 length:822 start_codon:yes stop_codon:yes gene_type:complete